MTDLEERVVKLEMLTAALIKGLLVHTHEFSTGMLDEQGSLQIMESTEQSKDTRMEVIDG